MRYNKSVIIKKLTGVILSLMLSAIFLCACANDIPEDENPDPVPGDDTVISVIINQIYGRGFEGSDLLDTAGSHSFVELYNAGNAEADLAGYTLYAGVNGIDEYENPWSSWNSMLSLSGKIPAKHSFLIAVTANTAAAETPNLVIADDGYDLAWPMSAFPDAEHVGLSNKNLKICLIKGTGSLTVKNPFNTDGKGTKIQGYVDMLSATGNDSIASVDAFEGSGAIVGQSKQKAVRRIMLADTDDCAADARVIDYRSKNESLSGISDEARDIYRPKCKKDGAWYGAEVEVPVTKQGLIINQIMGIGTKSNDGQSISHSFVELYNGSNEAIDLAGYTLQAAGKDMEWIMFELSGTVPPKHSFLIVLTKYTNSAARCVIPQWDMEWADGAFSNKGLKVVLLKSNMLLGVANPFDIDGSGTKALGYVDMIGVAGNDPGSTIDGYEGDYWTEQSKQKSVRRINFADTDNNLNDTEIIDFRVADLETYRPRSTSDGAWGI